jgi:ferredoxin
MTNLARGRRVLARAEGTKEEEKTTEKAPGLFTTVEKMAEKVGVSLGPIGMTLQEGEVKSRAAEGEGEETETYEKPKSIAKTNTSEWRERYVKTDGTVDLWLEDDFNVASRKAGACEDADTLVNIENYAWAGMKTADVNAPIRNVKVTDHETGEVLELNVPEGRYILFEAEQQGWVLPNACRMGGCTKCAVKMSKGSVEQPESLGLSKELRDQGYALLCVATAKEDVECVTQDEEEVYMKQFGKSFAEMALDKNANSVLRDDFALEIADMDE